MLLAEPPRPVPLAYRVAALGLGPWEAFALVLFVIAPMALWILQPQARTVAFVVAALLVVGTRVRRYVAGSGCCAGAGWPRSPRPSRRSRA